MSKLTKDISKAETLIVALGGIDISTAADLDGAAVTLGHISFNVLNSIKARQVEGSIPYTGADGVAHTLAFSTKQKTDGSDTIAIDGVSQIAADVDNDVHWTNDTVEFRFTDANAQAHQLEVVTTLGIAQKLLGKLSGWLHI